MNKDKQHWQRSREYKIIKRSKFFSSKFYLSTYFKNSNEDIDPIQHYLTVGWKQGYDPSPKFNTDSYLSAYSDVKKAGLCPLLHYLQYGIDEGRHISQAKTFIQDISPLTKLILLLGRKYFQVLYRQTIAQTQAKKIAVHLHLFYVELWPEIKQILKNLECYNWDLFVTTPTPLPENLYADITNTCSKVVVYITPNQGFDVGPFMYFLHKINLKNYDFIFKLHTKRNVQAGNYYGIFFKGKEWRQFAYEGILGIRNVHKTIHILSSCNKIGLIAHANLISNQDPQYYKEKVIRTMRFYHLAIPKKYEYVIGTIFAVRAKCLQNVKTTFSIDDFAESKREEFSLAHCVERALCLNILAQGYRFHGNSTFFIKKFIRRMQVKNAPNRFVPFLDNNMLNNYQFYQNTNYQNRNVVICSLLQQKNPCLYAALFKKANLSKKQQLEKESFAYQYALKDLILERIIARIKSQFEETIFRLVGEEITVEKHIFDRPKLSLLTMDNLAPQFVYIGKYLQDIIQTNVDTKNIVLLTKQLHPYLKHVFNTFSTHNHLKLAPAAWDALPHNTILDNDSNYHFFDINLRYLPGVKKSYFLYRVVHVLCEQAQMRGINYTDTEKTEFYNLLCQQMNICGYYENDRKQELCIRRSLHRKANIFCMLKHWMSIFCFNTHLDIFLNKR